MSRYSAWDEPSSGLLGLEFVQIYLLLPCQDTVILTRGWSDLFCGGKFLPLKLRNIDKGEAHAQQRLPNARYILSAARPLPLPYGRLDANRPDASSQIPIHP